jgi:hypothetical protein
MNSTVLVIAIVVIIVVAVAAGLYYMRENRRRQLRERFGPEYDRAVAASGDPGRAEKQLQERVKKHKELEIRDLDPEARNRYAESWRTIQARFVDDPRSALREADILVTTVMGDRGYPTEGFEQQADVVSVDHSGVVENYRSAHSISVADTEGRASTDDLRQAMVHYRALFNDLLGQPTPKGGTREEVR